MTQINIYKIQPKELIGSLAKLVESLIEKDEKSYLLCKNIDEMNEIDNALWTSYKQLSFIPHGTTNDEFPEEQPLLLGTEILPLNNPTVIISIDNYALLDIDEKYKKMLFLSEKDNMFETKKLKNLQQSGIIINIFEKDTNGKWLKIPL